LLPGFQYDDEVTIRSSRLHETAVTICCIATMARSVYEKNIIY